MILKVPISRDRPLIQTPVVSTFVWEEVKPTQVTDGSGKCDRPICVSISQSGSAWFPLPARC